MSSTGIDEALGALVVRIHDEADLASRSGQRDRLLTIAKDLAEVIESIRVQLR